MNPLRSITKAFGLSMALLGLSAGTVLASGSISGTVTDASNGARIAGLSVCAEENFLGGVNGRCTNTDPAGHYSIAELAAGTNYQVEFTAMGGPLNYLTQYWQGKEGLDNWDAVTIEDGVTR